MSKVYIIGEFMYNLYNNISNTFKTLSNVAPYVPVNVLK